MLQTSAKVKPLFRAGVLKLRREVIRGTLVAACCNPTGSATLATVHQSRSLTSHSQTGTSSFSPCQLNLQIPRSLILKPSYGSPTTNNPISLERIVLLAFYDDNLIVSNFSDGVYWFQRFALVKTKSLLSSPTLTTAYSSTSTLERSTGRALTTRQTPTCLNGGLGESRDGVSRFFHLGNSKDDSSSERNLCKDVFPKWLNLDDSNFSVETIAGGITNLLLKVSVREENGDSQCFTVRLFGPNTDYVINRERELQAIKYLSAAGFGAKLLGVFGNGMVQSFINARTLTPPASALSFDDAEKQEKYETISFTEVHNEVDKLKELTRHLNSPVVFAHNDLLCGNIMVNEAEEKLYFIDFEYGSYNYRGFDIGNHFNEYAGYECDYNLYPTKDEQYHFFKNYLNPDGLGEVSDKEIEALYVETSTYTLASHLYWALWALIQAKLSPIDFDYLEYFFLRYNQYKSRVRNAFLWHNLTSLRLTQHRQLDINPCYLYMYNNHKNNCIYPPQTTAMPECQVRPPDPGGPRREEAPLPLGSGVWKNEGRSFATVAKMKTESCFPPIQLAARQYGSKDGKPAISFTAAELQVGIDNLKHTLVAKFSGGRQPHRGGLQDSLGGMGTKRTMPYTGLGR
ncbi:unnamed protein product [Rhodiola kirilowii]